MRGGGRRISPEKMAREARDVSRTAHGPRLNALLLALASGLAVGMGGRLVQSGGSSISVGPPIGRAPRNSRERWKREVRRGRVVRHRR